MGIPSGVTLRRGCLSRTEVSLSACTQSACKPSPAPAGTVEEKCGWDFIETSLNKPVEGPTNSKRLTLTELKLSVNISKDLWSLIVLIWSY